MITTTTTIIIIIIIIYPPLLLEPFPSPDSYLLVSATLVAIILYNSSFSRLYPAMDISCNLLVSAVIARSWSWFRITQQFFLLWCCKALLHLVCIFGYRSYRFFTTEKSKTKWISMQLCFALSPVPWNGLHISRSVSYNWTRYLCTKSIPITRDVAKISNSWRKI